MVAKTVLNALAPHEKARAEVMRVFRALGGDIDRWKGPDRRAMVEALVRAEDATELAHPMKHTTRDALRAVRRDLECECYP